MTNIRRALEAAAGVGGAGEYVEDVFSTYVYTGTGATLAINNGIDLDGEGGMVWIKNRTNTNGHRLIDTARGVLEVLESYDTTAEATESGSLTAFNSNGFTVGDSVHTNEVDDGTVSWTFRKTPGFFDVVTYTGNGVTGRTISHNLGSVPAVIIVKRTNVTGNDWQVYHKDAGGLLHLNTTVAASATNLKYAFGNDSIAIAPTSSVFTIASADAVNNTGSTYIAYLFAHDDQSFGADSDESIIKCGSFTSSATWGNYKVDLGWEPQYVLIKQTGDTGSWTIFDSMRGIVGPGDSTLADTSAFNTLYATSDDAELKADSSAAESLQGVTCLYSQGIIGTTGFGNRDYIYMAIRRPMKVPEAGTEVFAVDSLGGGPPGFEGVLTDWAWKRTKNTTDDLYSQARLTGPVEMKLNATDSEGAGGGAFDYMDGWLDSSASLSTQLSWMFKRAPGFMDVVLWTNPAGTQNSVDHGLGVVPELVIVKYRDAIDSWYVYTSATGYMILDTAGGIVGTTDYMASTTASVLNVTGLVGNPDNDPIAFLFATVEGVSKVGTYTADATVTTIDCGFSAAARFILIKKRGSGDWYYWDYFRGIVAGDDSYLVVNETAAEVTDTDWIDPDSSGFTITAEAGSVSGGINIDTEDYIFLAIA